MIKNFIKDIRLRVMAFKAFCLRRYLIFVFCAITIGLLLDNILVPISFSLLVLVSLIYPSLMEVKKGESKFIERYRESSEYKSLIKKETRNDKIDKILK